MQRKTLLIQAKSFIGNELLLFLKVRPPAQDIGTHLKLLRQNYLQTFANICGDSYAEVLGKKR
jgi:hypothetical protein